MPYALPLHFRFLAIPRAYQIFRSIHSEPCYAFTRQSGGFMVGSGRPFLRCGPPLQVSLDTTRLTSFLTNPLSLDVL